MSLAQVTHKVISIYMTIPMNGNLITSLTGEADKLCDMYLQFQF